MVGETISHYRILSKLGEGGMGVVYKAEDVHLRRIVALKFLHASDDAPRLLREAQAAASLMHPNICAIHEVDPEHGFLTMEFVDGNPLNNLIGSRPLQAGDAVALALQIGEGLKAAHQKGIVHRDIKSANIIISREGQAKILDFGLARVHGQAGLTLEGAAAGTPGYMAPEQLRGEPADRRTDIWAFGAVLHEMLTGRLPIGSVGALPQGLDRAVVKALAASPSDRYQHIDDLLVDLRKWDSPQPHRSLRWIPLLLVSATLVVAGTLGWIWLSRRTDASAWKNATFTQITNQPGQELFPCLSPDGKSLVYAGKSAGNWDIYLLRVGGKNPVNLTMDSPDDDTEPIISPDGEWIAFRSTRGGSGIFVMGATGESVRRVADFGFNPAWSPDGRQIVCATRGFEGPESRAGANSQLYSIPAAPSSRSTEKRLITASIPDAMQPDWSPRGRRIAFWSTRAGNRDVWTMSAEGDAPVQVTREPSIDWHPRWSPDGKYLYFLSDRAGSPNLWRSPIDEDSGRVLGPPEQVTTPSAYTYHFSLSRDGQRLAYVNRAETGNIYAANFDPVRETVIGPPAPVTNGSWRALLPDISPDGHWVVFNTWRNMEDLYVCRTDGSELRQLTDDAYLDRFPRWSPDGKRLAFYSNRGGSFQVWMIDLDGSKLQQLTRFAAVTPLQPIWAPDGSRLAVTLQENDPVILEIGKPWDESKLERLPAPETPDLRFSAFSWSPDTRRLAGHYSVGGVSRGIAVYSFDSRRYQRFTDHGWFPTWLSDSRRLIFHTRGEPRIHLLDTHTGKTREILSVAPNGVGGAVVSRDGRRIYFGQTSNEADVWMMSRE